MQLLGFKLFVIPRVLVGVGVRMKHLHMQLEASVGVGFIDLAQGRLCSAAVWLARFAHGINRFVSKCWFEQMLQLCVHMQWEMHGTHSGNHSIDSIMQLSGPIG